MSFLPPEVPFAEPPIPPELETVAEQAKRSARIAPQVDVRLHPSYVTAETTLRRAICLFMKLIRKCYG